MLKETLLSIERLLRAGQNQGARDRLEALKKEPIPRAFRSWAASLAWQGNRPDWGVRLLQPIVRSRASLLNSPSEDEVAEYSACLVKVGAVEEGLALLESVNTVATPRAILYRAIGLASLWDYRGALDILRRYTELPGLGRYEHLLGKVELAAALVFEGYGHTAKPLLSELIHELHLHGYFTLLVRALGLAARNFLTLGLVAQARPFLLKAKDLLRAGDAHDQLYVDLYLAIGRLAENGPAASSIATIEGIRGRCGEAARWEALRECDRWTALLLKDETLFGHLYFGTPYEAFRQRLRADWRTRFATPDTYTLRLEDKSEEAPPVDLGECIERISGNVRGLEGQSSQIFQILLTDFYRPFRIATLHFRLYPDQYFNPFTSPARIHVAIDRLRNRLQKTELPLRVEESGGSYRLCATAPFAIRLRNAPFQIQDRMATRLGSLRQSFASLPFSAREASRCIGTPLRSTQRLLDRGLKSGALQRVRRGNFVSYLIVPPQVSNGER